MTLTRRRFLSISAAALCAGPALAMSPARWRGVALGAEAEITLHGPGAGDALAAAVVRLRAVERCFSLYDPGSELSRLNRVGRLRPSEEFRALVSMAETVHRATDGAFDPSVQPLWQALALGGDVDAARAVVGWDRVAQGREIVLGPGQALTFNGIAQGFATDAVAELLAARGFDHALVDAGEFRVLGGPWRLGLADPAQGYLGTRTLTGAAVATSSPGALMLGDTGHILDPRGQGGARWSTVSVEAERAALADAFSTACCLMAAEEIRQAAKALPGIRRVTLVNRDGDLRTVAI
ncbi:FAD:protein FMN transferase [Salipiger sp. P9]|uniref:FAD:protein FMN transferase n=1 Tax=Salipiger pentaromativorans TaxID=2943193 RepID=UPI00215823C2|nr:FAD:protein FMN transferase [Salipiger pentaromativorans]MCR8547559.1 FAD:protein FMN transferase [Salipiger pentaromativorans]